ncbi:MAG: hypothetical protein ACOC44_00170 [Promethearchaeia archaeon]
MKECRSLRDIGGVIITLVVIVVVLMIMIVVGFSLGNLLEDPDGLERALIDAQSEEWLEGLPSVWDPILGWIESDYVAGIIGIGLSVLIMVGIFYGIVKMKQRSKSKE